MRMRHILIPALICLVMPLMAQQEKAKALVKEAIAFGKKNGKEALLKEVNMTAGRFHVQSGDDMYVFIYDMKGLCMGMGFQSAVIGTNRWNLKDPDGVMIVQELAKIVQTKGSGWLDYKYPNPKTNKLDAKISYVEGLDGWLVGCGIYK